MIGSVQALQEARIIVATVRGVRPANMEQTNLSPRVGRSAAVKSRVQFWTVPSGRVAYALASMMQEAVDE
jgi:hypothetical protein